MDAAGLDASAHKKYHTGNGTQQTASRGFKISNIGPFRVSPSPITEAGPSQAARLERLGDYMVIDPPLPQKECALVRAAGKALLRCQAAIDIDNYKRSSEAREKFRETAEVRQLESQRSERPLQFTDPALPQALSSFVPLR